MAKKQRVSVAGWLGKVEYPTIGKVFSADISKYPEAIREEFLRHGWKQKFGDAESGGTPSEKYAMVQRMHEGLMNGQWELTSNIDMTPVILEAVSRIKKFPLKKLEMVAQKSPEKVKEWGQHPKVRAEIAQMRAEKAAKAAAESNDDLNIDL
jgi:hypothetical protein